MQKRFITSKLASQKHVTMIKRVFILFVLILFIPTLSALNKTRAYEHISKDSITALRQEFGNNKSYPSEYEEQFLIALSHYPQLKDVTINLIFDKEKTTMSARPVISSLFCRNRKYNIRINNADSFKGILLSKVPFNAQIGVIGHELAHIVDYEEKSFGQIITTGIGYLSRKYKRKLEHRIDSETIKQGLGWQLLDWAKFSMDEDNATKKYIRFKKRTYMSPEKILLMIENKN